MKINNPAVTPMMARGTVNQMISGCRKALNRKITTRIIIPKYIGMELASWVVASAESSASPDQAIK